MKPLQELIDQAAVRVAPSPRDGQDAKRESRILVRISEKKVQALFEQFNFIFDHAAIPDHDAYFLKREVCRVVDEFLGRARR